MNLSEELRRQLVQSVFSTIGFSPPPETVRALVGSEALVEVPAGASGFQIAQWVVRYSLNRRTPDLFLRVVEAADQGNELQELRTIVDELRADSSKWTVTVADALWIPTGWPFIDRKPVRDALTAMADGDGPAALSIEGPFGNGKRTIGEYVRYLAAQTQSFEPVIVTLRPEPEPGVLYYVASELWNALREEADLDTTHAEPDRQATTLALQIAVGAPRAPTPIWFVANIVNDAGLEEGVLTFVDELLRLVQETPSIAEKLRVLVLCDQLSLLELDNPPPLEARHTLPQITDLEIQQWLEAVVPDKPADLYRLTAATLIQRLESVPLLPSRKLRWLSSQCALAHRKLAAA